MNNDDDIKFVCSTKSTEEWRRIVGDKLGVPIEVVSQEKAEEAEFVVCVPWGPPWYFDDDLKAQCSVCGQDIKHRPHAPKHPPKICVKCVLARLEAEGGEN